MSKKGKASGIDQIPIEVLRNDNLGFYLHVLFNVYFDKGIIPSMWNKCIISPIPKSSTTDPRDPLLYRGIALASSMYKLYCSVLNTRISSWCEENYKITDEQNGIRKNRSTIDHVATLTDIIDTRKKPANFQRTAHSLTSGRHMIALIGIFYGVNSKVLA